MSDALLPISTFWMLPTLDSMVSYMTHLDLWILAQHFRIPVVLIAAQIQHPLVENQRPALVLSEPGKNDTFYYVTTAGRTRDVAITYGIVRTITNEMKFSLTQCTDDASNGAEALSHGISTVEDIHHHQYGGAIVNGAETVYHGAEAIIDGMGGDWV